MRRGVCRWDALLYRCSFFSSFCLLLILQHNFLWTRIVHDCLCLLSLSCPTSAQAEYASVRSRVKASYRPRQPHFLPSPTLASLLYVRIFVSCLRVCPFARRTLTSSWGLSLVWRCCPVLCGKGSRSRSLQEVKRDKDISAFPRHPRTASHPARTAVDPALAS